MREPSFESDEAPSMTSARVVGSRHGKHSETRHHCTNALNSLLWAAHSPLAFPLLLSLYLSICLLPMALAQCSAVSPTFISYFSLVLFLHVSDVTWCRESQYSRVLSYMVHNRCCVTHVGQAKHCASLMVMIFNW